MLWLMAGEGELTLLDSGLSQIPITAFVHPPTFHPGENSLSTCIGQFRDVRIGRLDATKLFERLSPTGGVRGNATRGPVLPPPREAWGGYRDDIWRAAVQRFPKGIPKGYSLPRVKSCLMPILSEMDGVVMPKGGPGPKTFGRALKLYPRTEHDTPTAPSADKLGLSRNVRT